MSLTLLRSPVVAAYCWKTLIALVRECDTVYLSIGRGAAGWAERESLWPIKKFPLLRGRRTRRSSNPASS